MSSHAPTLLASPSATPGVRAASHEISADRFRHLMFIGEQPAARLPADLRPPRPRERRETPPEPLDPETSAFFDALCRQRGLAAQRYRGSILLRRRAACLRALRTACPREGARVLANDDAGVDRALGAVMIGVTGFFRDRGVFDALGPMLRPLLEERGQIDALSVACSDGSEVYSLGMLLAGEGLLEHARLWGVDCRREAIAAASEGIYPAESLADVPPEFRAAHFAPAPAARRTAGKPGRSGDWVQVAAPLRAACRWTVADAFDLPACASGTPGRPRPADIILCRNLAIYLRPEAAAELWARLVARLRPGGLLVIGKAERPSAGVAGSLSREGPCIFRKVREPR